MHAQQNVSEQIAVATANTHFGDAIRFGGGLDALRTYKPDILLLQEVTNSADELVRQLGRANYRLVHFAAEFGLAIALRANAKLSAVPHPARTFQLQKMGPIEYKLAQRFAKSPHRMHAHGMLAAQFATAQGQRITVVTARTTVAANRIARSRQIAKMGKLLEAPYFSGAVIVGGDMNHFPGPQPADTKMQQNAGLQRVELGAQPTWRAPTTKLYRMLARARRQPLANLRAQLDALLYRGALVLTDVRLANIPSDHRAIIGWFALV